MNKAIVVVNLAYKGPKRRGRGTGYEGLKATLKYLQYRDLLNNDLAQSRDYERWNDRGLGVNHGEIFNNCERLQSKHVLAWTWVVSPDPGLMALLPESKRRELLCDLTERVVEDYYAERGLDVPEYSYVLHKRVMKPEEGKPAQEHLHTHVVLPGTTSSVAERIPVYNNSSKGHDRLFREIANRHFEAVLDQNVGVEWRRLREEQEIVREDEQPSDFDDFFMR
jgi:hypothetical protein